MKRCPTCQRTFTDETQKFCPSDGTPLMAEKPPAFDPEATVMSSVSQIKEEASSQAPPPQAPPAPPQPPTPYYNPGSGAGSQPAQNIHQSAPPPSAQPSPAWPPAPPQQQPYYPQTGTPGAQPTPQWQGGPQQPGWSPSQPPQGQWGGGGYYPQQPGQYAQFGAPPAVGGKSTVALAALICGVVAFVSHAAFIVIVGTRTRDLYDLIWALRWLWLATGFAGLVLGIVGLITAKMGKAKAVVGLLLSVITLLLYFLGFWRWVI